MMKTKILLFLILVPGMVLFGFSSRNTTLYYAATHFPPWDINIEDNQASGINADVIRSIAAELGLTFAPVSCPWKRCLTLLEEGKIDMVGTVGRTPERERYLHFIEPTYAKVPDQVFYLPANSIIEINNFEDLYQFKSIGMERGARIHQKFDQDPRLKRQEVTKLEQLLKMLDRSRLEVAVGNEMVMDYMIKEMQMHGKFKKARYRFISGKMEYLAISRQSPHVNRIDEISQIIEKMKTNGKIKEYIRHYTKDEK